jgi:hypothetical protein
VKQLIAIFIFYTVNFSQHVVLHHHVKIRQLSLFVIFDNFIAFEVIF